MVLAESVKHHAAAWMALALTVTGTTMAGAEEEAARPVTVAEARRAPLVSSMELTGSVTARRHARLSSRTSGLIGTMKADAGDAVKAGEVLMTLDDELAKLALERVAAEREQAELEVAEARRLREEVRDLSKSGAFSRSEAQTRETSLQVKSAALRRTEAQHREQAALVERHRLVAPFDGVVSRKLAEEGEWVQTGTPVAELVETGSLRLDVQAPQELFAKLRDEEPEVTVRLDAYPEAELKGTIAVLVPVNDAVARSFLIRVEMEDPEGLAAAGMSGRAVFSFQSGREVLQVPRDAVVRFPDGSAKVWEVVRENGREVAKSRPVQLGQGLSERLEVMEGVEAGARLVLRGNEGLREGQPVRVLSSTSEEGGKS